MGGVVAVAGGGVVADAAGDGSVMGQAPQPENARERLLRYGAQALTDPELIYVVLGASARHSGMRQLADGLLSAGGGLRAIAQLDPQDLSELSGLGPARAAQVLAALELGRRLHRPTESRPQLKTSKDVFNHVFPDFCVRAKEAFRLLCLNTRNTLISDVVIAEGTQNFCPVDPREVFRAALQARAVALILVHNHPSGDPEPSATDRTLTRQLVAGARLLGMKILDHLIIGDGRYHSMLENGELKVMEAAVEASAWHECSR